MTSIIATSMPWRAICVEDDLVQNFRHQGAELNAKQKVNDNWLVDSFTRSYAVQGWAVRNDGAFDAIIVKDGKLCSAEDNGLACLCQDGKQLTEREHEMVACNAAAAVCAAFAPVVVGEPEKEEERPNAPEGDAKGKDVANGKEGGESTLEKIDGNKTY